MNNFDGAIILDDGVGTTAAPGAYFGFGRAAGGINSTGPRIYAGTGNPAGVVTAPVGSIWLRTDIPQMFFNANAGTQWGGTVFDQAPAATGTRELYVDGARTDAYTELGTFDFPYKTIQAAVDYVEANMAPAYNNPATISIKPQSGGLVYNETVVIKKGGITLKGSGSSWSGHATINQVVFTNATAASYATFVANGGLADPATHYGDLVADAFYPESACLLDINLGDEDLFTTNTLLVMGVGAANSVASYNLDLNNVQLFGTSYYRNVEFIWFQGCWINDAVTTFNVRSFEMDNGGIDADYVGDWNAAADAPAVNRGFVLRNTTVKNIQLDGQAKLSTTDTDNWGLNTGNLDLNATSAADVWGGVIRGNVTVEGDAALNMYGTHVQGNMTFDNTGGAVACVMDGGRYMGVLTDAGVRLTRTVGN